MVSSSSWTSGIDPTWAIFHPVISILPNSGCRRRQPLISLVVTGVAGQGLEPPFFENRTKNVGVP